VFYIALVILLGLTINAKTSIDRLIYGALAAAVLTVLVHPRGMLAISQLSF
jgi:hypothetical protein